MVQHAVHVVVGGAIQPLRGHVLRLGVPEGVQDVVHGRELALAAALGALTQLVAVVLDLGLVPQRHLWSWVVIIVVVIIVFIIIIVIIIILIIILPFFIILLTVFISLISRIVIIILNIIIIILILLITAILFIIILTLTQTPIIPERII